MNKNSKKIFKYIYNFKSLYTNNLQKNYYKD